MIFKWIVKFKSYEVINNIAIALITIMLISFVIGDKNNLTSNSRNDTLLDISDGGHIENLAVFELLRRECRLIIGVDAGMDSNYNFDDLKNLMRRAKNELNIELKFRTDYNPFEDIKPTAAANWDSIYSLLSVRTITL